MDRKKFKSDKRNFLLVLNKMADSKIGKPINVYDIAKACHIDENMADTIVSLLSKDGYIEALMGHTVFLTAAGLNYIIEEF